jgi:pimeloyl-ACP methyl ester carboxylesterase
LAGIGLGYWFATSFGTGAISPLVGAILLPLLTMALVTLVSAVLSRAGAEPFGIWVKSIVGEFLAGVKIFVLRQPWSRSSPVLLPALGGTPAVPVVLVHGFFCNHRIWDDVATALRLQGHAVVAVNLEPLFCSIDRYESIIEKAATELLDHSGQQQIALVGHSMGGLAIRAWMRQHGTQRVAKVLTLGTPHAGTLLGKIAHSPNGKQMLWQSEWLAELAASETEETRALKRIALTPQDNIVFPQRSQVLSGIQPVVFEGIGHLQMCTHQPVIQWIEQELRSAKPV